MAEEQTTEQQTNDQPEALTSDQLLALAQQVKEGQEALKTLIRHVMTIRIYGHSIQLPDELITFVGA